MAPLLQHLRGVCWTLPWLVQLLVADVALSALLPLSLLAPVACYQLASALAYSVWRAVQFLFVGVNGAHISVSGAPLPPGESAIVVANHVSWTDFYMVQELAIRARMLGQCRWFAKSQLKWVPFLGWGLWAMGMPLVTRNWIKDRAEIESVFGKIKRHGLPIWLISYSEATRYTRKKHEQAVRWCQDNGKPVPRHTLYPRTRGFIATVQALRDSPHVKAVYDVTIAYATQGQFMVAPTMWETLSRPNLGSSHSFHVHVERYEIAALPSDDDKLAQWLEDRWMAKSETLERLRQELLTKGTWRRKDS